MAAAPQHHVLREVECDCGEWGAPGACRRCGTTIGICPAWTRRWSGGAHG